MTGQQDYASDSAHDLHTLATEVRGLREDLQTYRDTIGEVLNRRLQALVVVASLVVLASVAIFGGAMWLLNHEQQRAIEVRAQTQAEACIMARNVQSQMVSIVNNLPDTTDPAFVQAAIQALSSDPCNLPDHIPDDVVP